MFTPPHLTDFMPDQKKHSMKPADEQKRAQCFWRSGDPAIHFNGPTTSLEHLSVSLLYRAEGPLRIRQELDFPFVAMNAFCTHSLFPRRAAVATIISLLSQCFCWTPAITTDSASPTPGLVRPRINLSASPCRK